jgi:hypothetical protein
MINWSIKRSKLSIAVLTAFTFSFNMSGCGGDSSGDQGLGDVSASAESELSKESSQTTFVEPDSAEDARLVYGSPVGATLASPLKTVASVALEGYERLHACLKNKEIGQPCGASDSDNIRETLKQVKELQAALDRTNEQLQAEFDSLRGLMLDTDVRELANVLVPMVTNTTIVGQAYEALALCASTTETTCRPYIGEDNARPIDVQTAIVKTKGYLIEKMNSLPDDLPVTAARFTGSEFFGYRNGLAEALWKYNKSVQDRAAGVKDVPVVTDARTVPILTPNLVKEHNSDIRYWVDVFTKYAFFRVMREGLLGNQEAMERRQAEANKYIADALSRDSVYGTGSYYILPSLPTTGVVLVDWADASKQKMKAWIVTDAPGGGRPLSPNDLDDFARIVSTYAPFYSFSAIKGAMPPDRWYFVRTPVERYSFNRLEVRSSGGNQGHGIFYDVDFGWLTKPELANDWCTVKARPSVIDPKIDDKDINKFDPNKLPNTAIPKGDIFSIWTGSYPPKMGPFLLDRIEQTWDQVVRGKLVEYKWLRYPLKVSWTSSDRTLGPGAWINCQGVSPGSFVELSTVPGVMAPVR